MKLKEYVEEQSKMLAEVKKELEDIRERLIIKSWSDEYHYLRNDCKELVSLTHGGDEDIAECFEKSVYRISSNYSALSSVDIDALIRAREGIINDLSRILRLAELVANEEII